jgi:phenylacetate-coenzyme A ligase PaaK-like adenylate-forming protein
MQCEAGKFHQNIESCRVDFQPIKEEHGGPDLGRILVTTFDNPWYFIMHYDVGDLVRLDKDRSCPCGRDSGLIVSAIEGRFINATLSCDGRLVTLGKLDASLSAIDGLDEYRLDQSAPGSYNLYLASQIQDRDNLNREAKEILRSIYGREAEISIIHREFLSPEDSGKYCLSKTLFPLKIEDYLDTDHVSF